MANRAERKAKAKAEKREIKRQRMARNGGESDYAKKKREQSNGNFRPTSPFESVSS